MALTAPERLAWSAALNVFSMAVEGLQSREVDPLADALLGHALRMVVEWLPRLQEDPEDAAAATAADAGRADERSRQRPHRRWSGSGAFACDRAAIVGAPTVSSRRCCFRTRCASTPTWSAIALTTMAGVLGTDRAAANASIAEIERLAGRIRACRPACGTSASPATLLAEAADHAMDDWAITAGPRVPDRDDVLELLTDAW